jgi:dTDP-4-dehydrorhamnose reductase
MKIVVTGSNGTLGRALLPVLLSKGHVPIAWDRRLFPVSSPERYETWLLEERPDAFIHLATAATLTGADNEDYLVTVEWTENLARIAERLNARLIFVSTVMVFSGPDENGPFDETMVPHICHPYGALKRVAEVKLEKYAAHTTVARIGWQIDRTFNGNQMAAHLRAQHQREGTLRANRNWKPACSFVEDSALALEKLLHHQPGLFHIDSNKGWSFADIAKALNVELQTDWRIEEEDGPHFDQRLTGHHQLAQSLTHRLPTLEGIL